MVEGVLSGQNFAGNDEHFTLNSPVNAILLGTSLRIALEEYSLFCITIPLEELVDLVSQLQQDNKDWAERAEQDPNAERILGSSGAGKHTYTVGRLVVLALSPAFLPEDQTLAVISNEHRSLDRRISTALLRMHYNYQPPWPRSSAAKGSRSSQYPFVLKTCPQIHCLCRLLHLTRNLNPRQRRQTRAKTLPIKDPYPFCIGSFFWTDGH